MEARITHFWKIIIIAFTIIGVLISINQLFFLSLFGFNPVREAYLYYLLALFVPQVFIFKPLRKKENLIQKIAWYDLILIVASFIIPLYFAFNAENIILQGWEFSAPVLGTTFAIIYWGIILEALRRVSGWVLTIITLLFSLYPLVTGMIPISFLSGQQYDFLGTATSHIFSQSSLLGIPFQTIGDLLIGFLVFGVVIVHTGGGDFFFNMAQSIFGKSRGGTAKVSVVGSAFFGMLSGSAISNTVTTGAMTIPSMKKNGYSKEYAAAIEATSSTGGTITPPIMGSAAFIMASFLAVPYVEIAIAAAIPAFLYFFAVFFQVDGYAAKNNLKGLPKAQLPSFRNTLKEGWFFIFVIVLMIYLLVALNSEVQSAYYASLLLIVLSLFSKKTRLNKNKVVEMFTDMGRTISEIGTIVAAVGLIVGGLSITGVAFSFSRELIALVGDNPILILIAAAITSFVLGMGMTVSAVYVFLAVIIAPALISLGMDPIASHLFVLFYATVSYITPPVALAVYAASGIAQSNPLKSSLIAVRLGIVTFLIPFVMIFNPEIIGRGEITDIILAVISAMIGVWVIASALEGYMIGSGVINSLMTRGIFTIGGLLLFVPGFYTDILGLAIVIIVLLINRKVNINSIKTAPNETNIN